MENLRGSQHPALLLKKCPECNFALKNQLVLSSSNSSAFWLLFCPNLTCSLFAVPQIRYKFEHDSFNTIVDDQLISEVAPDTSIESD